MSAEKRPTRSFYYPNQPETRTQEARAAHRMCADGQRRAADYGLRIHQEHGSGEQSEEVTQVMTRAARAEKRLAEGMDLDKRDLIAYAVASIYLAGELEQFVLVNGDFLLETYDGAKIPRNVHRERARNKVFH